MSTTAPVRLAVLVLQLTAPVLERAREFVELNEQVDVRLLLVPTVAHALLQTSATLLTELATFLGTFQSDLSAVSGHISELQGRSKTIEGRLASRRVRASICVSHD